MDRYGLYDGAECPTSYMESDPAGDYVLYEEAAKIESENAALRAARDAAIREIGKWSAAAGTLQAEVEALRKLCGDVLNEIGTNDYGDNLIELSNAEGEILVARLTRAAKGEQDVR